MMVVTRRGYSLAGLAVVLGLHAFLLYLLVLDRSGIDKAAATRYSDLLFISTPLPPPAARTAEPPRMSILKTRPRKSVREKVTVEPSLSAPVVMPPPVTQPDPFSDSARVDIGSLVKQAGKADRETRSEKEIQAYGPARDSMEAVMTKAFTAAKLAVPLKWYEAARIEELTPRGARKPIYQVKTAFGTYCLYYPDRLTEGTGQPRMALCPRVQER
jgi:hypothetical protein